MLRGDRTALLLDYVAMPKDDPPLLEQIVRGITDGCIRVELRLLGGETAILPPTCMPRAVPIWPGSAWGSRSGETSSTGLRLRRETRCWASRPPRFLHSNGYSLARKVVFQIAGLNASDYVDELGRTVGEELLHPTQIYVRPIRGVLQPHYRVQERDPRDRPYYGRRAVRELGTDRAGRGSRRD